MCSRVLLYSGCVQGMRFVDPSLAASARLSRCPTGNNKMVAHGLWCLLILCCDA
jgi:hypothetical protein